MSNGYDPCQDFQEGSDRGLVVDEELSASEERYLNLVTCFKVLTLSASERYLNLVNCFKVLTLSVSK